MSSVVDERDELEAAADLDDGARTELHFLAGLRLLERESELLVRDMVRVPSDPLVVLHRLHGEVAALVALQQRLLVIPTARVETAPRVVGDVTSVVPQGLP